MDSPFYGSDTSDVDVNAAPSAAEIKINDSYSSVIYFSSVIIYRMFYRVLDSWSPAPTLDWVHEMPAILPDADTALAICRIISNCDSPPNDFLMALLLALSLPIGLAPSYLGDATPTIANIRDAFEDTGSDHPSVFLARHIVWMADKLAFDMSYTKFFTIFPDTSRNQLWRHSRLDPHLWIFLIDKINVKAHNWMKFLMDFESNAGPRSRIVMEPLLRDAFKSNRAARLRERRLGSIPGDAEEIAQRLIAEANQVELTVDVSDLLSDDPIWLHFGAPYRGEISDISFYPSAPAIGPNPEDDLGLLTPSLISPILPDLELDDSTIPTQLLDWPDDSEDDSMFEFVTPPTGLPVDEPAADEEGSVHSPGTSCILGSEISPEDIDINLLDLLDSDMEDDDISAEGSSSSPTTTDSTNTSLSNTTDQALSDHEQCLLEAVQSPCHEITAALDDTAEGLQDKHPSLASAAGPPDSPPPSPSHIPKPTVATPTPSPLPPIDSPTTRTEVPFVNHVIDLLDNPTMPGSWPDVDEADISKASESWDTTLAKSILLLGWWALTKGVVASIFRPNTNCVRTINVFDMC